MGTDVTVNPKKLSLEECFKMNAKPDLVYETAGSKYTHIDAFKYV